MGQHLTLPPEQPLVLGLGILGSAVDESLDLVELVHADDAAGVLAVTARLPPEAGRPTGIPLGPIGQVDDLAGVESGQRHLGGADEVHVVLGEVVDLLCVGAEEPGARHDLRPYQHRRDHQRETVVDGHPYRELEQAELEQRPGAGEEVEAGTGHLRAAFHVDQPQRLPQLEVVLRIVDRRRLAHGVEDPEIVLAAGGDTVDDDVGDRHVRGGEAVLRLGLGGLGRLDLLRQLLGRGQQPGTLFGHGLAHQLAGGLLLGAQVVGGRDGRAPRGVRLGERVDERRVLAPGLL